MRVYWLWLLTGGGAAAAAYVDVLERLRARSRRALRGLGGAAEPAASATPLRDAAQRLLSRLQ